MQTRSIQILTAGSRDLRDALGRELDARDQPAVREILRSTKADGYRFVDVVSAIVKSVPFQMRQTPNN